MDSNSHHDFCCDELDHSILGTRFEIQTNWHVITGAPSCGKTTLIKLLDREGFQVSPEGARLYMEGEIARGRTVDELQANAAGLQRRIIEKQLEIERGLEPMECIFMDRAAPDTLAWFRVFGLDPNEFLRDCFTHRYTSVFILDCLPLELDGLRFKLDAQVSFLDEWHARDYCSLGYELVRVPVLPPEERLCFLLENLSERGKI